MRRLALLLSVALASACGAKNEINSGGPPQFDDAGPRDSATPSDLVVDCGRHDRYTAPRRPSSFMATASSSAGVASEAWVVTSAPPGSMPTLQAMSENGTLTAPTQGSYDLAFTAIDTAGHTASCSITVHAVVGPPVAICPEMPTVFHTPAHVPVRIEGDAFDDVAVVSAIWTVTSSPMDSMPVIRIVAGPIVDFVSATPGDYVLTLTAVDGDGAMSSCTVMVHVATPPVVTCPDMPITGPTRHPITVNASATDDGSIASTSWTLTNRPADSSATISPTSGLSTVITPDKRGEYQLTFAATDNDGEMSSCVVTVIGLPGPPNAICPPEVDTTPLATATVTGMADDDGTIVQTTWRNVSRPDGSRSADLSPSDMLTTMVPTDLAGDYVIELSVVDDDGNVATCQTTVRAVATEGLRVEMFWDTDSTDMDTHVLEPGGDTWTVDDDCNFRNCQRGEVLDWGVAGVTEDNPHLDIDDTDGFGPENINIDRPVPGTYRVGIHAWAGAANVTVRIYCGGSTTEPRQTFGPVHIASSPQDQFWRVADLAIDGASCTITPLLDASGGPDVRDEPGMHGGGAPR